MPSITLTPGSSASSIISLTFNAGASLGNIGFSTGGGGGGGGGNYDDPYSYVIQTAFGTYYWATSGGVYVESFTSIEATNPVGSPPTSADKNMITYDVRGLVQPDFIQAGFNYLLHDGFGFYTWCNSSGIEEGTPVLAGDVDTINLTASRVGEYFYYVDIIGGGGGS